MSNATGVVPTLALSAVCLVAGIGLAASASGCGPGGEEKYAYCPHKKLDGSQTVYHLGCDRFEQCSEKRFICWDQASEKLPKAFRNDKRLVIRFMDPEGDPGDTTWVVRSDGSGRHYSTTTSGRGRPNQYCSAVRQEYDPIARMKNGKLELRSGDSRWHTVTELRNDSTQCDTPAVPPSEFNGTWVRTWNPTMEGIHFAGSAVATDGSDRIYAAGRTEESLGSGTSELQRQAMLRRYNAAGERQWERTFDSGGADEIGDLAVGPDGAVYVAGWTDGELESGEGTDTTDGFLARIAPDGTIRWVRQLGAADSIDRLRGVAVDGEGRIFTVGGETPPGEDPASAIEVVGTLARFDQSGERQWQKRLDSGTEFETVCGVAARGGDVYVGAHDKDIQLEGYRGSGDRRWSRTWDFGEFDGCRDLTLGDELLYAVGERDGNQSDSNNSDALLDGLVIAVQPNGDERWTTTIGDLNFDYAAGAAFVPPDTLRVGGWTSEGNYKKSVKGGRRGWVVSLDTSGKQTTTRRVDTPFEDEVRDIAVSGAGHTYVIGTTKGRWSDAKQTSGSQGFLGRLD